MSELRKLQKQHIHNETELGMLGLKFRQTLCYILDENVIYQYTGNNHSGCGPAAHEAAIQWAHCRHVAPHHREDRKTAATQYMCHARFLLCKKDPGKAASLNSKHTA